MTKEVALQKKAAISKAQQYLLLSVLGAGLMLGICSAIVLRCISLIGFNATVLTAAQTSIKQYSDTIKNVGICTKPVGELYTDDELTKCNPNQTDILSVPGTLRYNILYNLAANENLSSVGRETESSCTNPSTGSNWTYDEMDKLYKSSVTESDLLYATSLLKTCSALRAIPDALPAYKNQSALLSSLNQIFNISGWVPESIAPSENSSTKNSGSLHSIELNFSVEGDVQTTTKVLSNLEKSIREFSVSTAKFEWVGGDTLSLKVNSAAYYVDEAKLVENKKTIKFGVGGK